MAVATNLTRIFFALWPDDETRVRIAAIAGQLTMTPRARRIPDHNLHLTLHFIGNVDSESAHCMRLQAREARGGRFCVELDRVGHFERSRVGWLGCSRVPRALLDLQDDLGKRLGNCGYRPEARRFRPHVTLARKIDGLSADRALETLHWRVDRFALVESRGGESGVRYAVLETYPLS